MDFNEKELFVLFKAIKILESGEELLGVDIDKKLINVLVEKFLKKINTKSAKKINKEIDSLIKEAREYSQLPDYSAKEEYEDYFDRDFGPNYLDCTPKS